MKAPSFGTLLSVLLTLGTMTHADAQLIPVRSVPVAAGDQFLVGPSEMLGMGSVSIAVDDTLADPFHNPAAASRVDGGVLFTSPVYYGISDGNGNAKTLPVGFLWGGREWFGGASLALQQVSFNRWGGGVFPAIDVWRPIPRPIPRERSANNYFLNGILGRRLAGGRTAVGASFGYAALDAVDGVELLYGGSDSIEQDGYTANARLGFTHELEGDQRLEALLLYDRFDMTHDVRYTEFRWDPITRQQWIRTRTEENLDQTDTWGAQLGYRRPLNDEGWKVGGILTGNYKSHPKIPNYEIMNIPRDPGHSWAYNIGMGVALDEGPALVGLEVIFEPIWSHTWADSDTAIVSRSGRRIEPGDKTIENDFQFKNALIRLGVGREQERIGFKLGLQLRSVSYDLDQYDNVRESRRKQSESWMEWTPTWGLSARFPEFKVRYAGRLTTGTGRPGIAWTGARAVAEASFGNDVIIAPGGPLTLQEARVLTHQITASIPIR